MAKDYGMYKKIVVLSTLSEGKALVDISKDWFGNTGRLFQPPIYKEVKGLVTKKLVVVEKKRFFKTDTDKFLLRQIKNIPLSGNEKLIDKYKKQLEHFYVGLGSFTQKVYLNYEVVKVLTRSDPKKLEELDVGFLLQLPFILRYLKYKDEDFAGFFIQILGLQEYVKKIEELEWKHLYLLKQQKRSEEWAETFYTLTKLIPTLRKKGVKIMEDNLEQIRSLR